MPYDLDRLKTVTFWDAITVRVPERWDCVQEPDGHWGCYEKDVDNGTLWIDFDVFTIPTHEGDEESFRALVRDAADGLFEHIGQPREDRKRRTKRVDKAPDHLILSSASSSWDEEEGEELSFSRWHHMGMRKPHPILVHLTFVLPTHLLADTELAAFARRMDDELRDARIDWDSLVPDPA